jgi:hypothetical protein
MSDAIDATVVEEPGAEFEPVPRLPTSLFRTDDPVEILQNAQKIADALAPVIRRAHQVVTVQGKDYLTVEAWQTLGQQVGVTPVVTSTTRIEKGWEARCEARTLDGRTIGAADSMCTREEERWADSADFEVRSMAQTRAMSRALASVLRFIPTLAGFGGTPAEEMGNVAKGGGKSSGRPSAKQSEFFETLAKDAGFMGEELSHLMAWATTELTGGKGGSMSKAIDGLKDKGKRTETADRLGKAAKAWEGPEAYEAPETGDTGDLPVDDQGIEF